MHLESNKNIVNKPATEVCDTLSHVENFEKLMPDNISKFEVIRNDAFVFALKGMPEIALEIKEVQYPNKVILGAISDKIPFNLTAHISPIDESSSEVQLIFDGEFNTMMAMMVKGPVTKFLQTLSENLPRL